MRGRPNPQRSLLAIADPEERVSQSHPLRRIKAVADAALTRFSPEFDQDCNPQSQPARHRERRVAGS